MRMLTIAVLALCQLSVTSQLPGQEPGPVRIPAFCGYAHPDANAVRRDRSSGAVRKCRGELRYYVQVLTPGDLTVALERLPEAAAAELIVTVGTHPERKDLISERMPFREGELRHRLAAITLKQPTTLCITLRSGDDHPLQELAALYLSGSAAEGARTPSVERRNASSVHLGYRAPAAHADRIEWFHCEIEPKTDPLWSYYMATGWHRGYFGMQVNSPTERRLIFSVWDSGDEAVDRKKVAADDRVQLVAKGDGVVADGFGNEGTGGHSHLVHDWRLGDRIRFLVHAQPEGTHTTYTGWYQHLRAGQPLAEDWTMLASFRAPKDGRFLHGLYSFSENFSGANGDSLRECEYDNVWLRTEGGDWLQLREARFTHDGHGRVHRLDRAGGVRGERFFLRHGDYATAPIPMGAALALPPAAGPGTPPQLPQ